MSEAQATLEYASDGRRRWRWRRGLLMTALVLGVGMCFVYRETILRRVAMVYWQQKCLNYTRPPGTAVATAAPPFTDDDYLQSTWNNSGAALLPECWRKFEPAFWRAKTPSWFQAGGVVYPTVFLHERVSPSGNRRLVCVQSSYANALQPDDGHVVKVIEPGSLWRDPKHVGRRISRFEPRGEDVRADFSFGQPDPADASHFTVDYAVDGKPQGTVDAWLQDDDTVVFKPRPLPATTPQGATTTKSQ